MLQQIFFKTNLLFSRWWSAFSATSCTRTSNGKFSMSRDVPNGKSSEIDIKQFSLRRLCDRFKGLLRGKCLTTKIYSNNPIFTFFSPSLSLSITLIKSKTVHTYREMLTRALMKAQSLYIFRSINDEITPAIITDRVSSMIYFSVTQNEFSIKFQF